jgi:hypothetical protein
VELQQVVRREAGDGRKAADAEVRAVAVVGMEPGAERSGTFARMLVGPGVGPFAQRGLNEALGLAVGARGIGSSEDVPQPLAAAQIGNEGRTVGGAIVSHDAGDRDPQSLEVLERTGEEGGRGVLLFVGQHLGVSHSRVVVDTDVSNFEARAGAAFLMGAGDARADAMEAAELLGVEVEQFAGGRLLVTAQRHDRIQCA